MEINFSWNADTEKVAVLYGGDPVVKGVLSNVGGKFGYRRYGSSPVVYGKLDTLTRLKTELRRLLPEARFRLTGALKTALENQKRWFEQQEKEVTTRITTLPTAGLKPFAYQAEDILKMSLTKSLINASEMGTGKSIVGSLSLPREAPVLLLCPRSMKGTWVNELARWRPDVKTFLPKTGKDFRFPEPGEVVIITCDGLPKMQDEDVRNPHNLDVFWKKYPHKSQLVVMADEAHAFLNFSAMRTKRFRHLCWAVLGAGGRAYALTGTPVKNRPKELWCLLQNLRLAEVTFGNWDNFVRMMGGYQGDYGMLWDPQRIDPTVHEILAPIMIARKKEEVLKDLPPVIYTDFPVELTDRKIKKFLDEFSQELGVTEQVSDEDLKAALANAQKRDLKKVGEYATLRKDLAEIKYVACLELIQSYEDQDQPLVVACDHADPVIQLGMRKGWACIHGGVSDKNRQQAIDDFQAGKLKGIAVSIKAGGVGITLTRASHMLFIDQSWVPSDNAQMRARCHRHGQKFTCQYIYATLGHWLEARIEALLNEKRKVIDATVGAVSSAGNARHTRKDTLASLLEEVRENDSQAEPGLDLKGRLKLHLQTFRPPVEPFKSYEGAVKAILRSFARAGFDLDDVTKYLNAKRLRLALQKVGWENA